MDHSFCPRHSNNRLNWWAVNYQDPKFGRAREYLQDLVAARLVNACLPL